ncbi:MAG: methyltransferase family protein [Planctomycetaceae bacterium]
MARFSGIAFGVGTHALLAATVWYVFWFLKGGVTSEPGTEASLWIDATLSLQFGAVHSVLLAPPVRERLSVLIPAPFYGCFFCTATCTSLLAAIFAWQPSSRVWWEATGPARLAISAGYVGSWVLLLYSIGLTGFGWQSGWTPWWSWVRGEPYPERRFEPRSVYRWLRHPVYLGFLGLIWFTPVMSPDRAILTAIWTAYVFLGSWLKDRRLAHSIGAPYREYQARVPGYPGILIGPLARLPQ